MTAVFLPLKEEELIGDFLSSLSFQLRRPRFPMHCTHHNYVLPRLVQKSQVSSLAIPYHCPFLPLLQLLSVPCPSLAHTQHCAKTLCSVHRVLVKRVRAASSPQAHREVAALRSTNLMLNPAPPLLTAMQAAGRAAAISDSVTSVGIHFAFAVWFLQRDSCWAAPFPWLVTCSVLLSRYFPLSLWALHPTSSRP